MSVSLLTLPKEELFQLGLTQRNIHYQLNPDELVQDTLRRGEGVLNDSGALVIKTGEFTGRSPKDKFTVKDEITANTVHWNEFNIPIEEKYFHIIREKIVTYLNQRSELWVRDCYASADPRYRINIRVVNETPWINLLLTICFFAPMKRN